MILVKRSLSNYYFEDLGRSDHYITLEHLRGVPVSASSDYLPFLDTSVPTEGWYHADDFSEWIRRLNDGSLDPNNTETPYPRLVVCVIEEKVRPYSIQYIKIN